MNNNPKDVAYIKGKVYTSLRDGCITDEGGNVFHKWSIYHQYTNNDDEYTIFDYFMPFNIFLLVHKYKIEYSEYIRLLTELKESNIKVNIKKKILTFKNKTYNV